MRRSARWVGRVGVVWGAHPLPAAPPVRFSPRPSVPPCCSLHSRPPAPSPLPPACPPPRSSPRASGAPRWRHCCAACCTCRWGRRAGQRLLCSLQTRRSSGGGGGPHPARASVTHGRATHRNLPLLPRCLLPADNRAGGEGAGVLSVPRGPQAGGAGAADQRHSLRAADRGAQGGA